jgi:hypothetical protein
MVCAGFKAEILNFVYGGLCIFIYLLIYCLCNDDFN